MALPAVLLLLKISVPSLLMKADPAVALFWNVVMPPTNHGVSGIKEFS
ncbi:MAG TPA: hypothetical protein VGA15_14135 [Bradyrhizobium sp.]